MKTPQVPAMPGMSPLGFRNKTKRDLTLVNDPYWPTIMNKLSADQKTVAERKWQSRKLAPAPQKACDVGLFSDDHKQTELKL